MNPKKPGREHSKGKNFSGRQRVNKKVMEFVKGKPKGTNPAIMGNPIDICAVNASKWQQKTINLITREPHLNNHAQCKKQNKKQNNKQTTCSLSKEFIVCDLINILFSIYQK